MLNIAREIRRSIGLMQAAVLLAAMLLIGLFLSALQLNISAQQYRKGTRTHTENVLILMEGPATRAAWTLDQKLAKEVLDGVMATEGLRAAILKDDRGGVLATSSRKPPASVPVLTQWVNQWLFDDVIRGRRELIVTGTEGPRPVGVLSIEQDPNALAAGFVRQAQGAVLATLTQSLLLGLLLLWVVSRLVTSHLRHAAAELAAFDPEHTHDVELSIPALHRDNELGHLLRNTNELVARLQESRRELTYVASHDPLTHLPNRLLIREELELALARCRRAGASMVVIFLDIDRFKTVNDLYGHELGDALLIAVAGALRESVRETDQVGRLSGDEFLIVVEGIDSEDGVVQIVRRVVAAASGRFDLGGRDLSVAVSVGVAVFPFDADDTDSLIRHADLAMYRVKREPGLNWQFYSSDMGERAAMRLRMETDLAAAASRGQLELYYQPRLDAKTRTVNGCEALVRWWRDGTLVNAASFVPVAEDSGLILEIGRFVLDEACRQATAWHRAGNPVYVSVNISGRQLKEQDIVAEVRNALDRHDTPPGLLKLELTESMLIENLARSGDWLSDLRDAGVEIEIDDFGTGYSSLVYLIELPAASLKIDRSFVSGSKTSRVILEMIIAMARSLAMRSVAEGVETEEQYEMLRKMGCDEVQGYLFGAPVNALEFHREHLKGDVVASITGSRE